VNGNDRQSAARNRPRTARSYFGKPNRTKWRCKTKTAEFATAAATPSGAGRGDNSVRDDNYDFIKAGLTYITTKLVYGQFLKSGWLAGRRPAWVEATGMGAGQAPMWPFTHHFAAP